MGGWGRGGDVCCDLEDEEGPISSMQGEEGSLAKAEKGREHVWALIPRRHYTKEGERQKVIVDSRRAAADMCGGTNDPATCFPFFCSLRVFRHILLSSSSSLLMMAMMGLDRSSLSPSLHHHVSFSLSPSLAWCRKVSFRQRSPSLPSSPPREKDGWEQGGGGWRGDTLE